MSGKNFNVNSPIKNTEKNVDVFNMYMKDMFYLIIPTSSATIFLPKRSVVMLDTHASHTLLIKQL